MTTYYIVVEERKDGTFRVFGETIAVDFMVNHFYTSRHEAEHLAEIHRDVTKGRCIVHVVEAEVP